MKDEIILRLLEDACEKLKRVNFPIETPRVGPLYDALLAAVKANHPDEPYLNALVPLAGEEAGPEELKILFGQLRILLEAMIEEERSPGPTPSQRPDLG